MIKLNDIIPVLHDLPIWVNYNDNSYYYKDKKELNVPKNTFVKYITVSGDNILTVEISDEVGSDEDV